MKRYAIVRVRYDNCPIKYMIPKTYKNRCILHNKNCEQCRRNGDTKEQLIRKVAQALLIDKIERYRRAPNCDVNQTIIEHESRLCLERARKIVEFLGVE